MKCNSYLPLVVAALVFTRSVAVPLADEHQVTSFENNHPKKKNHHKKYRGVRGGRIRRNLVSHSDRFLDASDIANLVGGGDRISRRGVGGDDLGDDRGGNADKGHNGADKGYTADKADKGGTGDKANKGTDKGYTADKADKGGTGHKGNKSTDKANNGADKGDNANKGDKAGADKGDVATAYDIPTTTVGAETHDNGAYATPTTTGGVETHDNGDNVATAYDIPTTTVGVETQTEKLIFEEGFEIGFKQGFEHYQHHGATIGDFTSIYRNTMSMEACVEDQNGENHYQKVLSCMESYQVGFMSGFERGFSEAGSSANSGEDKLPSKNCGGYETQSSGTTEDEEEESEQNEYHETASSSTEGEEEDKESDKEFEQNDYMYYGTGSSSTTEDEEDEESEQNEYYEIGSSTTTEDAEYKEQNQDYSSQQSAEDEEYEQPNQDYSSQQSAFRYIDTPQFPSNCELSGGAVLMCKDDEGNTFKPVKCGDGALAAACGLCMDGVERTSYVHCLGVDCVYNPQDQECVSSSV
ncbi:expressed unknown protein [Seminavis robusta]|uniref:Uncharacterized protein n=1 Tax=Seminavis robusta TaxID=568900 RepID=A0A9N8HTW6_9STRA|nr:expressed unknown protein [Seminavis robusta]|eukprot:Sro1718_g293320.1 n/a (525) ;mRNA; r:6958-9029